MLFIAEVRKADGSELNIEIALREALANAVIHGNGENPNKRVYVVCHCSTDGELSISIRNQGEGFDSRAVPDPTTPENSLSTHGRGICVMRAFMDEVRFEEGGSVVHMRRKSKGNGRAPGSGASHQPPSTCPTKSGKSGLPFDRKHSSACELGLGAIRLKGQS